MTRFALIPLALLANACASTEDVQDNLTDMTYDLQRDIEEMTADADRNTDASRQQLYDRTHELYGDMLQAKGCEMVGALYGTWTDNPMRLRTDVFTPSGELTVRMEGMMEYTGNDVGTFGTKGYDAAEDTVVFMEGDWDQGRLEADILFDGFNEHSYRIIGQKADGIAGGTMIAAMATCH